jgi:hypothetical protein
MKFPALALAFSLASGVLVAQAGATPLPHIAVVCLVGSFLLLLCGLVFLAYERGTLAWTAALLAWCLLGAAAAQLQRLAVPADHVTRLMARGDLDLEQPLRWHGRLRSDPLALP